MSTNDGAPDRPLRVFGWAADAGGCMYYRLKVPFDALADRGHQVEISTLLTGETRENVDVVVGQRVCQPHPTRAWQAMAALPRRPMLVFEVDDHLLDVHPTSDAHGFYSQPTIRANLAANARVADLVTVSTEPLAKVMRQYNPNVVVLPNCLPPLIRELPTPVTEPPITIGWQGSRTHLADWAEVIEPLRRFMATRPEVVLHTLGAEYAQELRLPPDRWRHDGWRTDMADYYRALTFDIGLAPLRPHPFNRCKSGIRAMEYAARAIPVVASAVTPYEDTVEHGVTGFLVRRPHEWRRYLDELLDDGTRIAMAEKAHERSADWQVANHVTKWEAAYSG